MRDAVVAVCSAVALAASFPKLGATWLVPFAAAAQFWVWQGASWKRAALLGWLAGIVFFAIGYDWIGHTVGGYIGAFGPFLMLGPALVEAPFFALAAVLAVVAYRYLRPGAAPLAAAAAFAFCEWLRSVGILGAPFDQLGYTQAGTPLRALGAYLGSYGITLTICIFGAYLADALHRRTWRPFVTACVALAGITAISWLAWPARHLPPPTVEVAAIQGNIAQSLKWNALDLAIFRYTLMTRAAAARKPKIIVWPETVVTTTLNLDDALMDRFTNLARQTRATIVAGSLRLQGRRAYNSLYFFQPDGLLQTYDKRQLVPFAESFPGRPFLSWLPYVGALSGRFSTGKDDSVYPTAAHLSVAPLICWESAFSDLAFAQVRNGAQLLVISTDDAWFGTTSGPYMHAQIAQMRAIESGAYVVRAAATGISGVIAPDGTWQNRSRMEERVIVAGKVGPRVPTLFAVIGPTGVALLIVDLYVVLLLVARRKTNA